MTVRCCVVCSNDNSNYKCPKCSSSYCSVSCCNEHKSNCCGHVEDNRSPEVPKRKYKHITEDTVPEDKLELLGCNKKLLEVLENPHLRRIMEEIDSARSPENLIGEAMLEPIFVEFANECLKTVNGEES